MVRKHKVKLIISKFEIVTADVSNLKLNLKVHDPGKIAININVPFVDNRVSGVPCHILICIPDWHVQSIYPIYQLQ